MLDAAQSDEEFEQLETTSWLPRPARPMGSTSVQVGIGGTSYTGPSTGAGAAAHSLGSSTMVSTILVDTITPRPEPLQAMPHHEQAPVVVRLRIPAILE
jgi:hypothetical protein